MTESGRPMTGVGREADVLMSGMTVSHKYDSQSYRSRWLSPLAGSRTAGRLLVGRATAVGPAEAAGAVRADGAGE
jgi:hypothetical protein